MNLMFYDFVKLSQPPESANDNMDQPLSSVFAGFDAIPEETA